ncbi:hypothetical protein AYI70_g7241 [Smittium culicis]|uniref:Uncharacterized protein n=1 Tax=Smittium culicis TaxID=133412 RepID=A0A1R1XLL1_9FUNG|nr:hypothetical protein AYI70_g7241 [Smittium culicis]
MEPQQKNIQLECFHRKNWCLVCRLCLTCPRKLRNRFGEGSCRCEQIEMNLAAASAKHDHNDGNYDLRNEPTLSYRLRRFTPMIRKLLNEIIYIFYLKGSPIPNTVMRGNLCSTCQQRLRRAQHQYLNSKVYGRLVMDTNLNQLVHHNEGMPF